jgi:adenylate cyclase class IV
MLFINLLKGIEMKYYYVTQEDKNGDIVLKGCNLTEEEKDELFYFFNGSSSDTTLGIRNSYGCHNEKFNSTKKAFSELISKPKEFNDALAIIQKFGFDVYPKISKTVSYQQHFR